jgi:hypothetical protein
MPKQCISRRAATLNLVARGAHAQRKGEVLLIIELLAIGRDARFRGLLEAVASTKAAAQGRTLPQVPIGWNGRIPRVLVARTRPGEGRRSIHGRNS